jgi:hypothetical protein
VCGIGLVAERRFKPGTILVVEFPAQEGIVRFSYMARVVWVAPQEDATWLHSCCPLGQLTSDQLRKLIQGAPET